VTLRISVREPTVAELKADLVAAIGAEGDR
jgi:hypothetical protein